MKRKNNRQKGNQKGFTLIELLVAVAIFAIAIVPLLSAFLTSVRTQNSAKNQMRATTVASNTVETMKSSGMTSYLSDAKSDSDVTYEETDGVTTITTTETIDGREFTVVATVDETYEDDDADDESTDYNATSLATLYSINQSVDAVYLQSSEQNARIIASEELKNTTTTATNLTSNVKHVITISITDDGTDLVATVSHTYTWQGKTATVDAQTIFDGSSGGMRNLYFFYTPLNNSSSLRIQNEILLIENTDSVPVNIYVVAQGYDSTSMPYYRLATRVIEGDRDDIGTTVITKMLSNLPVVTSTRKPGVSYYYKTDDGTNAYTDEQWSKAGTVRVGSMTYEAGAVLGATDLSNETEAARVYNVTVNVYEGEISDGERALATLTSTIEK